jgi:hypothetical protein
MHAIRVSAWAPWRRVLPIVVVAIAAALTISFTAPQEALAFRDPNVVLPGQEGWVTVRSMEGCELYCPTTARAYRWTGTGWSTTTVFRGSRVYAYPFVTGWHWVWTQETGWLATRTTTLETGYRCDRTTCPIF